jgi:hypothetical protein
VHTSVLMLWAFRRRKFVALPLSDGPSRATTYYAAAAAVVFRCKLARASRQHSACVCVSCERFATQLIFFFPSSTSGFFAYIFLYIFFFFSRKYIWIFFFRVDTTYDGRGRVRARAYRYAIRNGRIDVDRGRHLHGPAPRVVFRHVVAGQRDR